MAEDSWDGSPAGFMRVPPEQQAAYQAKVWPIISAMARIAELVGEDELEAYLTERD